MGDAKEWRQGVFGVVRNGLLALQVAHLSRWWETSDALVGVLGVLTSILDISQVWPEKSVAVPSTKEEGRGVAVVNAWGRRCQRTSTQQPQSREASGRVKREQVHLSAQQEWGLHGVHT